MKLIYKPQVIKQVKKLPDREKKKIVRKLNQLSQDKSLGKPLLGEYSGYYSLRAWPYRIIFQIKPNAILIVSVSHRQGVYK